MQVLFNNYWESLPSDLSTCFLSSLSCVYAWICHGARGVIRGQFVEVTSILSLCGSWGSNTNYQTWWQVSFHTEPSLRPRYCESLING